MKSSIYYFTLLCFIFTSELMAKERADYIVIGVGTAGATISKLLSDDPNTSVIALHSGKNLTQNPDIKLTKNAAFTVFSALLGSSFFQTGPTVPQPNANNNELLWVFGLPLGGTSSTNAGAWARGTDQVYDQWEPIAGPEWSSTQIRSIYKNLENFNGITSNPAARGFNGPLDVRQNPSPTAFALKFSQAVSNATGVPIIVDDNDPNTPIGVNYRMQYTQSGPNGDLRASSATAFLNESVMTPDGNGVSGRKLTVKFKSRALRTIWKGNKAVGVEYFNNGKIKKVYANKGVIVCGGLYSSNFLMHSGVGPKDVLHPLGIKVKYDNPNVGNALADQNILIAAFLTNPADTPSTGVSCGPLPGSISVATLNKSFLFNIPEIPNTNFRNEVLSVLFCSGTKFPGNSAFAQIAWLPAPGGDPTVRQTRITTINPIPGLAFALVDLVQPQSRGRISINSFNPFNPPIIDSGIFSNPDDLALYVQVFQTYVKDINMALQAMDNKYELIFPLPEILDDTVLLTEFIKEAVGSNQCFQSHCRMAPLDQGGVVNSFGQVYGVENLYVADDSIVPVAMDGTPMATAYLIAANIARLLLE